MGPAHTRLRPTTIDRSPTKETNDSLHRPSIELRDKSLTIQVDPEEQKPILPADVDPNKQEDVLPDETDFDEDPDASPGSPPQSPDELDRDKDVNLPEINADRRYDSEDTMPVIWLDIDVNDSKENIDLQEILKTVTKSLTVFNDDELCEEHIRQLTVGEQVIFIVAGSIGVTFIPLVYDSIQLSIIYVYSVKKEYYLNKFKQYEKVEVITEANSLLNKILNRQIRQQKFADEQLSLNIFTRKDQLLNESQWESNDRFMWIYVFMKIFFRISYSLKLAMSIDERFRLFDKLQELYPDAENQNIISKVKQEYSLHPAVYWYTYPGPIYKTLNKAFRERNLELLFIFRDFILDLCKRLIPERQMHDLDRLTSDKNPCSLDSSTESVCSSFDAQRQRSRVWEEINIYRPEGLDHIFNEQSNRCVYRGQSMSPHEIEQLENSVGELVSVNSFLSTSLNKEVANNFASSKSREPSNFKFVLFIIEISVNDAEEQYGYIGHISHCPEEEEVLFAPGTVFEIQEVLSGSPCNIRLRLCSKNNPELERITSDWEKTIALERNQTLIDWLIMRTDQLDQADKYYQLLLEYLPDKDPLQKYCCSGLGNFYHKKKLFPQAIEYHTRALKTAREMADDSLWLAKCCTLLANTYMSMDRTEEAHELYQEALSIYHNQDKKPHRELAECYSNIGRIHQEKENYVDAEFSFKEAREHYRANLIEHPPTVSPPLRNPNASLRSLITSVNNLAEILRLQRKFVEASERQYEVIKICKQYLRGADPEMGHLYIQIGHIYRSARRFELALTFYHKAAEIYYYTYPEKDIRNVNIRNLIEETNREFIQQEATDKGDDCYEPPDLD